MRLTLLLLLGCTQPADKDTGDAQDTGTGRCADMAVPMALVPGGTYTLGSPESEVGREEDEALHEVTLTQDYCVGITAVTQAHFERVMGYNPSYYTDGSDRRPVEEVNWHEAAVFTNLLSQDEGLEPCYTCSGDGDELRCMGMSHCLGYRLPTEAEWEVAARGGELGSVPGGGWLVSGTETECKDTVVLSNGTLLGDRAWYCGNAGKLTHKVGLLRPNGYGLRDMIGQVWEWCHDGYAPYEPTGTDPIGQGPNRVNRGASWNSVPHKLRAAKRDRDYPEKRDPNLGFRIVRAAP